MASCIIERIGGVGVDCDDATATPENVLNGYTFGGATSEELLTGTMPNRGTKNYSITENGGQVAIENGQHSGSGKVTYTLPSVNGGTTVTPVATAQTVTLADKYLKNNISVLGSTNLIAGNILKGKSLWGVNGNFINYASVSQVYNGSAFAGFLSAGLIDSPTAGGTPVSQIDGRWCGHTTNNAPITSGSLYTTNNSGVFSSTYYRRVVSAKSVNFSLFSTLRIVGNYSVSAFIMRNANASIDAQVTVSERTNSNGTTEVVATDSLRTPTISMTGNYDGTLVGGNANFDLSFDISSWTSIGAFFDLAVRTGTRYESSSAYVSWRSESLNITGIYLS